MSPNKIRAERSEQETDSVAFTKEQQGDHRISAVKAIFMNSTLTLTVSHCPPMEFRPIRNFIKTKPTTVPENR
ncbi:MAG: hypothetical protein CME32_06110 [Gimesia sp.]|nr:hypothetical protein [Gimesia sp.]